MRSSRQVLSVLIYVLVSIIGILAFLYPLVWPFISPASDVHQTNLAPIMLTVLVSACFVALLLEVQGGGINTKFVALLGVLVAMNATLRFVEVTIPGPGGFSPIFFLIILTGYVYGGRFGFLMGALTLLVSALLTGGIGPWLPYQMLAAGWVGLSMPLWRPLARAVKGKHGWGEVILLAFVGAGWGFLYGLTMNPSSWVFVTGPAGAESNITLSTLLQRYGAFYVTTSLLWDVVRALGNSALILLSGRATLKTLRRFERRFAFVYHPLTEDAA